MNILVPTDFSQCAEKAFLSGINLAKKYNGNLHLFHASNIPDDWLVKLSTKEFGNRLNNTIRSYATSKMNDLCNRASLEGLNCRMHYSDGKLIDHLGGLVKDENIELIVMGSHGLSAKNDWMIGSNAQKCIKSLKTSVMVLKEVIQESDFKKVAFVSSLQKEDREAFRHFLKFINPMKVDHIHILYVNTIGWYTSPVIIRQRDQNEFEKMALGYNCTTHIHRDYSVDAGVRHFIEQEDIGFIGISNHKRHPIRRFFQGSNVELLVNHLKVPVLSIDYL